MGIPLPDFSQQNESGLSSQTSNVGGMQRSWHLDPDLYAVRQYIIEKILQAFRRRQVSPESHQHLPEFVRRLEEGLFKEAASKEEYMDLNTLDRRMESVVESVSPRNSCIDKSSLPSRTSNIGGMRRSWHMDPDLYAVRQYIIEKILQGFRRRQISPEWHQHLPDFVRRLEEGLFKEATSKEEYMDLNTLDRRLLSVVKSVFPCNSRIQNPGHHNSSGGTMIPTPGLQENGNASSMKVEHP